MDFKELFNVEQVGLLEETLNIGAGNAVTALSQILQCDTDMSFPVLNGLSSFIASSNFRNYRDNSTVIEMSIVGELQGEITIIISQDEASKLSNLIRKAKEEQRAPGVPDISILTETANIMTGSFLTAIHDFCGLNIFHTIPVSERNISEYMEYIQNQSRKGDNGVSLVIANTLSVNKSAISAHIIVLLSSPNAIKLINAIEKQRKVLISGEKS